MYYFSEAITDTKGNALIGFFVKAVNTVTGEAVSLYSDESGTPIENVSGYADMAKVNSDGNAQFYVDDGKRHLDIYASDATTFIRRIENKAMTSVGMLKAASKAEVAATDTNFPVYLTEAGSTGIFTFDSSDLSIQVTADPEQTVYIAPSSDDTGASGAWVRAGTAPQADSVESGVVSGCAIAYRELLIFDMSAGTYVLDGVTHTAAAQSITLAAADGTNPRIDILYLDAEGVLQKVTGTPAASPSKPSVDPTAGLELTFVLVPAGATTLSEVTTENIYLENTEWTTSQSGSAVTLNSTNSPYAGTVCIERTGSTTGAYFDFNRSSNLVFGGDGNLILRIKSKTASWNTKRTLLLQWVCDGAALGSPAVLRHGAYGLDVTNVSSYQVIIIPKSVFGVPANLEVDQLRITFAGTGNSPADFYMDNIQLQTNGSAIGNSDLTQSIADARYVNVTGDTMTGDLQVPDEAYDATAWNGSLEVPTKNAIRDKLESLAPGGVITGALLSANNLSDLANATTARTNLGLGSIATQAASSVSITGGSVTGITDLAIADGGTGSSTASGARTNLGIDKQNLALPLTFNFTDAADAYFYADEAMTLTQQATTGAGTVSYAKGTTAAPDTFSATTSPISLQSGAWLKVTAGGAVAVHLKRTA